MLGTMSFHGDDQKIRVIALLDSHKNEHQMIRAVFSHEHLRLLNRICGNKKKEKAKKRQKRKKKINDAHKKHKKTPAAR